ncbi:MAG: shikimate dehydrogenase family protein [Cyclobacteriaceae bacterium]
MEKKFGLIGQTVSHSFSKAYFDEKFFREGLRDYHYDLYPLNSIDELRKLVNEMPELCGLNVTVPYKEQVMKFLDEIDTVAKKIGAVIVLRVWGGRIKCFNPVCYAFRETLVKWYTPKEKTHALILGTGGSSKAVREALTQLGIPYHLVSREKVKDGFTYDDLEKKPAIMHDYHLIINTTPLGMSPNTSTFPPIPYDKLTHDHYVYDLIYNPARTVFLQKAEMRNAVIKNGLEMLHVQAEKSWAIWNN